MYKLLIVHKVWFLDAEGNRVALDIESTVAKVRKGLENGMTYIFVFDTDVKAETRFIPADSFEKMHKHLSGRLHIVVEVSDKDDTFALN